MTAFLRTVLVLCASASAWTLAFNDEAGQRLTASGTADVSCNNIRSSFNKKVYEVIFDARTDYYPDPSQFTVYTGAGQGYIVDWRSFNSHRYLSSQCTEKL